MKDAPIVLLDEATASLDVENETKVQGALSRLLVGKTVLVIAHRMRTVEAALPSYGGSTTTKRRVEIKLGDLA